jgi:hypothetical protein
MNHFWCRSCFEKIGVMMISINFVLVFEKREKNSAKFEYYDLKDDNESDPSIW